MTAVMIDTSEFVEELEKEGVEHKQARAFVNVVRRSQEAVLAGQVKALEEVSTRTTKDLDSKTEKALTDFKHEVDKRFAGVDVRFAEMNGVLGAIRAELTMIKWLFALVGAGVISMLIRSFFTG